MGSQSSFSNVNLYDEYFLKSMFEKSIIYPDYSTPNIDSIKKLQEFYMRWFVEESKKQPFTFPINTVMFNKDEEGNIKDKSFLNLVSELNCYNGCFNIFTGETGIISSCCFNGEEIIEVKNKNTNIKESMTIKDFVDKFLDKNEIQKNINSDYTICSYDKNGNELNTDIIGILRKNNNFQKLIEIECNGKKIKVTPDHVFMAKKMDTEEIISITALELLKNSNNYLLPTID